MSGENNSIFHIQGKLITAKMFKAWGTWLGLDGATTPTDGVDQPTDAVEKNIETSPEVLDSEVNKERASVDDEEGENGDEFLQTKGLGGTWKYVFHNVYIADIKFTVYECLFNCLKKIVG